MFPIVDRVVRRAVSRLERHRFQSRWFRRSVLHVGEGTYGNPKVVYFGGDSAKVTVGRYCSISEGVEFLPGGQHNIDWVSTFPFREAFGLPGRRQDGHPASKGDICIGNDVWLGRGAKIMSGCSVGDGAVVGAYSVVTSDIPPYGIAVGVPARVIRNRFSDEVVEQLLAMQWWDWPQSEILAKVEWLNSVLDPAGLMDCE